MAENFSRRGLSDRRAVFNYRLFERSFMSKKLSGMYSLLMVLLFLLLPIGVQAAGGAYHPPAITVVVLHSSPEAEMKVTMVRRNGDHVLLNLEKERRGWENCFRLYRQGSITITAWYGNSYDFKDAVFTLTDKDQTYTIPVPYEKLKDNSFNDFLLLDLKTGEITVGVPATRTLGIFLMHLAIYLLVEGAVLWIFRIRERRSWIVFVVQTVLTKGFLCYFIRDWLNVDPRSLIFFIAISVFFIALDMAVYIMMMEETKETVGKIALFSNILGAIVMHRVIVLLPM